MVLSAIGTVHLSITLERIAFVQSVVVVIGKMLPDVRNDSVPFLYV